jgi:hypothetical protein
MDRMRWQGDGPIDGRCDQVFMTRSARTWTAGQKAQGLGESYRVQDQRV